MIKLNIFNFEGYQVIKLKDIESKLTANDYKKFLGFLEGKTMTIDKNNNTLVFYSDLVRFLNRPKINFTINKIN